MQLLFKQAVSFNFKDSEGKALKHEYKSGTSHEVPDIVLNHPYFEKLVNAGLITDAPVVVENKPLQERQKDLMSFLKKQADEKAKALSESVVPKKIEESPEEKADADEKEKASKSTKKQKG